MADDRPSDNVETVVESSKEQPDTQNKNAPVQQKPAEQPVSQPVLYTTPQKNKEEEKEKKDRQLERIKEASKTGSTTDVLSEIMQNGGDPKDQRIINILSDNNRYDVVELIKNPATPETSDKETKKDPQAKTSQPVNSPESEGKVSTPTDEEMEKSGTSFEGTIYNSKEDAINPEVKGVKAKVSFLEKEGRKFTQVKTGKANVIVDYDIYDMKTNPDGSVKTSVKGEEGSITVGKEEENGVERNYFDLSQNTSKIGWKQEGNFDVSYSKENDLPSIILDPEKVKTDISFKFENGKELNFNSKTKNFSNEKGENLDIEKNESGIFKFDVADVVDKQESKTKQQTASEPSQENPSKKRKINLLTSDVENNELSKEEVLDRVQAIIDGKLTNNSAQTPVLDNVLEGVRKSFDNLPEEDQKQVEALKANLGKLFEGTISAKDGSGEKGVAETKAQTQEIFNNLKAKSEKIEREASKQKQPSGQKTSEESVETGSDHAQVAAATAREANSVNEQAKRMRPKGTSVTEDKSGHKSDQSPSSSPDAKNGQRSGERSGER